MVVTALTLSVLFISALRHVVGAPTSSQSQAVLEPYATKPRITFNKHGTFKLTVFSDLHFGEDPATFGPEQDSNSTRLLTTVLGDERPDFAVINGDLITGENTFRENVTCLIDQIVAPFNRARTPFAVTLGNHDNQANFTHAEEIERLNEASPFSYTRLAPKHVGGFGGEGNYWVPVYESPEDHAPVLVLWFFDSRGGVHPNPDSKTPVPDWVDSTVADWIKSEVSHMEDAWGPAGSRQAVAFVHIPPHAIQAVQRTIDPIDNPGQNADRLGIGSVQDSQKAEYEGKDEAFWDSVTANVKNLRAIISGHDHGNEWCARERKKDVIFCFDKHSGYGGYGSPGWGHGVRNLVFGTPDPWAGIDTWIRFENGIRRARVILDESYDRE